MCYLELKYLHFISTKKNKKYFVSEYNLKNAKIKNQQDKKR